MALFSKPVSPLKNVSGAHASREPAHAPLRVCGLAQPHLSLMNDIALLTPCPVIFFNSLQFDFVQHVDVIAFLLAPK